jgi:hypothetical protein
MSQEKVEVVRRPIAVRAQTRRRLEERLALRFRVWSGSWLDQCGGCLRRRLASTPTWSGSGAGPKPASVFAEGWKPSAGRGYGAAIGRADEPASLTLSRPGR